MLYSYGFSFLGLQRGLGALILQRGTSLLSAVGCSFVNEKFWCHVLRRALPVGVPLVP